jgi:hypothetical protein
LTASIRAPAPSPECTTVKIPRKRSSSERDDEDAAVVFPVISDALRG